MAPPAAQYAIQEVEIPSPAMTPRAVEQDDLATPGQRTWPAMELDRLPGSFNHEHGGQGAGPESAFTVQGMDVDMRQIFGAP